MYVLLNLKDGSRLTDVVQLLFAHGHTAVSVAEKVEHLCPTCERSAGQRFSNVEHFKSVSPTTPTFIVPECKPEVPKTTSMLQQTDIVTRPPSPDAVPNGEVSPVEVPHRETSHLNMKVIPLPPVEPAEVKEEPSEFVDRTSAPSTEQPSNGESSHFIITSALELLGHANTSNTDSGLDQGSFERETKEHNVPHSKRKARIEMLGLETFQCQLCKKAITRQGQYANLVNHLSRHARLHASKKQYCCPVCRASFSRRYLAYAHVREAHPKIGHVEPLDHGRELREEYRALLEVCFPGASSRRKTVAAQNASDLNDVKDMEENDLMEAPEQCGVLSQLLEQ
ncbi:hypothetical protein RB195_016445 [Necator americanus]|uniref:C2H2-type domain-containing protein n=1 Tax=Necator americanus TaxID=51031 RepID=A0ABR1C3Q5_NECAM